MSGSNLRFPKVFVTDPGATAIVSGTSAKPRDLTLGQVGFFKGDTLLGAGATPSPTTIPNIQIHQNVGDSSHGTVRSKVISAQKVKRIYGVRASAPTTQIIYIGYDQVDATKNIVIKKGDEATLTVLLWANSLLPWYGRTPYRALIPIELNICDPSIPIGTELSAEAAADEIVLGINGRAAGSVDWPENDELTEFLVATKVTTGTGDDQVWGVKVETIAVPETLLNSCDPKDFYEGRLNTFSLSMNSACFSVPVTQTQSPSAGSGWAAQVANYERESQGYDRVRNQFEDLMYMKGVPGFVINAKAGTKYDYYFLEYDWVHPTPGVDNHTRQEPFDAVLIVPTTTGAAIEAFFNAWLGPLGFTTLNVDSGTVTGQTVRIENA